MSTKTRFINKRDLKAINEKLVAAGYPAWPGDRTSASPAGQGSGYASNLIDWMNPTGYSERQRIESIVTSVIGE